MTKDQLWAKVNQAASPDDLDAVEAVAVEQGYSEDGLLRSEIARRRDRLTRTTARTPATTGKGRRA
jgi:hypothetical protein